MRDYRKAYIYYLAEGNHFLLNIVVERKGVPGGVLVRRVKPVEGVAEMIGVRGTGKATRLSKGPGRVTAALALDGRMKGCGLTGLELLVRPPEREPKLYLAVSRGTAISQGKELHQRYYIPGKPFVSAKRNPALAGPLKSGHFYFGSSPSQDTG